jgi:sigma-B regulation protein RsbU (phosphoserine phosphatase)
VGAVVFTRARRAMKRPARILVVDDESGMVRAVERVLAGAHDVLGSRSSPEALVAARRCEPDLVILDVRMPEIDGFELMARLKAEHPGVDIIVMTGSLDDLDQKLIRAIRGRAFYFIQKPFDREVLQTLVDRCLELRWRRLEGRQHVERLERELADARAFQQGLLPPPDMAIDRLAVSCRYESCVELGGDLCDYVSIGPGRIAVLVADVMGHGVSAAMLTGVVKSAFRAASPEGYEPRAMVQRLWSNMDAFGSERFVTLIAAVVSVDQRRVDYVNAGHPAALLWTRDRRVTRLTSTGPLVSPALRDCAWEQRSVPFGPGDLLFLYTDGVSDAFAEGDEEAIVELIRQHPRADATLLDAVMERVREESGGQPQPDDLTLLSVRMQHEKSGE